MHEGKQKTPPVSGFITKHLKLSYTAHFGTAQCRLAERSSPALGSNTHTVAPGSGQLWQVSAAAPLLCWQKASAWGGKEAVCSSSAKYSETYCWI